MSAEATEAPPVPRRRVRWALRALIAMGLLLGVAALAVWVHGERTAFSGRAALKQVIAETDELDPRWRWEDIDAERPVLANPENSIRRVREAMAAQSKWGPNELQTADGKDLLVEGPANRRLDEERLTILVKAMQKQQHALAIAATLKDLPRGRSDIRMTPIVIDVLLPHAQECREAAYLLQLDCERLLHEGRLEDAADRIRGMLNAGAGMRHEPFLICTLVRFAIRALAARQVERALAMGELKDETCRKLMEAIGAERDENLLLAGVRGERAGIHILFDSLEKGVVPLADVLAGVASLPGNRNNVLVRGGAMLYGSRLYDDHANYLRWLNRACTIAGQPWHEQAAEWAKYEKELKAFVAESRRSLRNILTTLLTPALQKVASAAQRDQALLTCTHTALALERYRLANKRWPKALDELRPKFLARVPLDPYDGKPLRYKVREGGVVVYSVGQDGKDDGGEKLSLRGVAGTDAGVQLWDVELRGLPAEPKKPAPKEGE